jgi:hypothetical protein
MDTSINKKVELLEASYWEHYKFAKDLSFIYPIDNPKRLKIESEVNKIRQEIIALNNGK